MRGSIRALLIIAFGAAGIVALIPAASARTEGQQVGTTTTSTTQPVVTTTTTKPPVTTTTTKPTVTTTTPQPEATTGANVTPIVECSFLDPGTGLYNTVWGYENNGTKDAFVPVGTLNSFNNPGANAGQPTTFKKGRAQNVFIVTHKGSSTWKLTDKTATAPGAACKTNPVPVVAEGLGGLVVLGSLTVILGLVLFLRLRRVQRRA
jgi:hypothetical protein